jgi:hypothetical protein
VIKYCLLAFIALPPPSASTSAVSSVPNGSGQVPLRETQDDSTKIKDVILPLPQFYLNMSIMDALEGCPINLPPENSHWRFYFQRMDRSGQPNGKPAQVAANVFYGKIRGITSFGVKDTANISDPEVNSGFVTFIRTLVGFGIFNKQTINWVAAKYLNARWSESCYFLEEAAGNLFTDKQWQEMHDHPYNGGALTPYFDTLARIRLAKATPGK